jgi:hypothetical protein
MIALLKWTSVAFAGVIASTFLFILAVIFAVNMLRRECRCGTSWR